MSDVLQHLLAQEGGEDGRLIDDRLTFTPRDERFEFQGVGTVEPVLGGLVQKLASPRGLVDLYHLEIRGETRRAA